MAEETIVLKTVKIGPLRYRVVTVRGLRGEDGDGKMVDLLGHVSYFQNVIEVDESVPTQSRPLTLLHESIHAILYHAGYEDHAEELVMALTYGLADLIADNPDLVGAIFALNGPEEHEENA